MNKVPKNCKADGDSKDEKNEACKFIDQPLYSYSELSSPLKRLIQKNKGNERDVRDERERDDWINEFQFFILKKGTRLVHTTNIAPTIHETVYDDRTVYDISYKEHEFGWWKKKYVGQLDYGGGWFTYDTETSGPMFNYVLEYSVQNDIPILYIPNHYKKAIKDACERSMSNEWFDADDCKQVKQLFNAMPSLSNQKAFEEWADATKTPLYNTYHSLRTQNQWTSSHFIPGVKNWKQKGYDILLHTSDNWADELGMRIASFGFPGYISCDECEVFISHQWMEYALSHPKNNHYLFRHPHVDVIQILEKELPNEPLTFTDKRTRTARHDFSTESSFTVTIYKNDDYHFEKNDDDFLNMLLSLPSPPKLKFGSPKRFCFFIPPFLQRPLLSYSEP